MITSPYNVKENGGKDTASKIKVLPHSITTSRNHEKNMQKMISLYTFDPKVVDTANSALRLQRMSMIPVQQPYEVLSQMTTPGILSEKSVPSTLMTSEITPNQ